MTPYCVVALVRPGSDIADLLSSFFDGVIETTLRAAREITTELDTARS